LRLSLHADVCAGARLVALHDAALELRDWAVWGWGMQLSLLGPLVIVDAAGAPVAVTSAQQRRLLAVLGLAGGGVVSVDQIIESLWRDSPPETAVQAVQVYVSGLRKALGKEAIRTAPPGYRLGTEAVDVDVVRFEQLVSTGSTALAERRFGQARSDLEEALALWRGRCWRTSATRSWPARKRRGWPSCGLPRSKTAFPRSSNSAKGTNW
jgi:DNA-binding SARP family transcriptional activator